MSRKPLMLPFLKFHRKNRKKAPTKKAPRKKWEYCTDIKDDGKLNTFLYGLTDLKSNNSLRTLRWTIYRPCLSCFFYDFALPYYNKWIPIMKWVLIKYSIMESSSEKNGEKVYILVYCKIKQPYTLTKLFLEVPKEQSIKGLSHRVRQRKN